MVWGLGLLLSGGEKVLEMDMVMWDGTVVICEFCVGSMGLQLKSVQKRVSELARPRRVLAGSPMTWV